MSAKQDFFEAMYAGDTKKARAIMAEHKLSPDIRDNMFGGSTAVGYAVKLQDHEFVAELIRRGADVNARCDGVAPIHMATDAKGVQLLAEAGADLNARLSKEYSNFSKGATPLHFAAVNGNADVLTALLKAGAKVNVVDRDGFTPLDLAAADNPSVADELIRAGAEEHRAQRDAATNSKLSFGILAHRFLERAADVKVSAGFRVAIAAAVSAVLLALPHDASAQAPSSRHYAAQSNFANIQGSAAVDMGGKLKETAQKVFGAVGDAFQSATAAVTNPVTDNSLEVSPIELESNATRLSLAARTPIKSPGASRQDLADWNWKVIKVAGGGSMKQYRSPDGTTIWLNRKGEAHDFAAIPAVRYPDGGFEHFQNGKLTPVAGGTLVARNGQGVEIHLQDGRLTQRAPVVDAKFKPVATQMTMR